MCRVEDTFQNRFIKIFAAVILTILFAFVSSTDVSDAAVPDDLMKNVEPPQETSIETAKNGLVEIQTGLMDGDSFRKIRQTRGILISNDDSGVYVITTAHSIKIRQKDRKKAGVDENAQVSIRIIIRGDVASELSVMASSKKQDFCILQSEDVVNSKTTACLRCGGKVEKGDSVCAFGFPSDKKQKEPLQYEAEEVEVHTGEVESVKELKGVPYIRHTAVLSKNGNGGMLTDEDGYVIGINNSEKTKDNSFFALDIEEVIKVLDNYDIQYSSDLTQSAYAELYNRCQKAIKQDRQSRYKSESKIKLEAELESSVAVLQDMPNDLEKLQEANELLEKAQDQLKTKIEKTTWIIIILGIVIIVLLIRFFKLLVWRKNNGIKSSSKKSVRQKQNQKKIEQKTVTETDRAFQAEKEYDKTMINIDRSGVERSYSPQGDQRTLVLFWIRGGERIVIDKPEYIIGKKKESVDFAIEDNRMVSRIHAKVKWTPNSGFMIIDMGSSNGTYLNEQPVSDEGAPLRSGDLIRLANEEFEVELL